MNRAFKESTVMLAMSFESLCLKDDGTSRSLGVEAEDDTDQESDGK